MFSLNGQRRLRLAVAIAAQLLVIASCALIERDNVEGVVDQLPNHSSNFKPLGLFDYDNYKKTFNKKYTTSLEDSTRRCYFYARAMAVFVSGVNYKYRIRDHYNALNEMSDWSPMERDKIKNKRSHSMVTRSMTREMKKKLAFLPAEGEQPDETLRKFLESKRTSDPIYQDLLNELFQAQAPGESKRHSPVGSNRMKRSTNPAERLRRNFSFDKLINYDPNPEPIERKVRVKSNNPEYQFIETMSRGLKSQIEEVDSISLEIREENEKEMGSLESQLESKLGSLDIGGSGSIGSKDHQDQEDVIYIDHRDSVCMSKVRSQGKCGSCYAFAATTIVEWLYCKKKGLLVDFSEQYMVDCGLGNIEGMFACDGGTVEGVYEFVHNFGVELRSRYPYLSKNDTCPYDDTTNLKKTGYIRVNLNAFISVPIEYWHMALKSEPIYIMVQLVDDFYEYGGGVYDGAQCLEDSDDAQDLHSMVLVGHGREGGQEYWLIRNSHGRHWGEKGYYKLAKSASKCIYYQVGHVLTWNNGQEVDLRPFRNRQHDDSIIASKSQNKSKKDKRRRRHRH